MTEPSKGLAGAGLEGGIFAFGLLPPPSSPSGHVDDARGLSSLLVQPLSVELFDEPEMVGKLGPTGGSRVRDQHVDRAVDRVARKARD